MAVTADHHPGTNQREEAAHAAMLASLPHRSTSDLQNLYCTIQLELQARNVDVAQVRRALPESAATMACSLSSSTNSTHSSTSGQGSVEEQDRKPKAARRQSPLAPLPPQGMNEHEQKMPRCLHTERLKQQSAQRTVLIRIKCLSGWTVTTSSLLLIDASRIVMD
jgi:hypothetical protein